MLKSTCQQALDIIADTDKVMILIEQYGDPLSKRARHVLHSNKIRFEKLGYKLLTVAFEAELAKHEELSCVRLPQIRIFRKHKLYSKYVGVPSDIDINNIFKEAMCYTAQVPKKEKT
jgi:hypothetical protein